MALVNVEIENKSGQVVGLAVEDPSDQLDYLRKLLKRDELERVDVVKSSARKPAATK